jgi:gluconolactonase
MINRLICLLLMTCSLAQAEESVFLGQAELVVEGAGEGPAWHPELGLLFSGHGSIQRYSRDGKLSVYRRDAGTNGLLFDQQGRLVSCEPVRRVLSRTEKDGTLKVLADRYEGRRFNQPNDVTIDSRGRIYFSDPKYGPRDEMEIVDADGRTVEGVYRIDLDGQVTRIITHQVDRPNGVLVSSDDRWLYVADNNNNGLDDQNNVAGNRKLWRFDLQADGTVDDDSRRLIFDWTDSRGPDGMVQDTAGRLYVAGGLNQPNPPFETNRHKGGVYVFSAAGKLLAFAPVPRDEVTNCTFGGDDLRTLYITAGGTLWSVRTRAQGDLRWPR